MNQSIFAYLLLATIAVYSVSAENSEEALLQQVAEHLATWCSQHGKCSDFLGEGVAGQHSVQKRAASQVRDLCKFYGVKCKRGVEVEPAEGAVYQAVIDSFIDHCTATAQCDFRNYLAAVNSEIRNRRK